MSEEKYTFDGEFKTTIDGETASIKLLDDNAFYANTDLTKKVIKEVFDHADKYIATATEVASAKSLDLMVKNKKVNNVDVELPYGVSKLGRINVQARRSHTYPGNNGNLEPVTKSTLRVTVKDPLTKMSKTKIRSLEAVMTKKLLS